MARKCFLTICSCLLILFSFSGPPPASAQPSSPSEPFAWKMNASFRFAPQQSQQDSAVENYLKTSFPEQARNTGVQSTFSQSASTGQNAFQVAMSGSGGLDQVRAILYGGSPQTFNPILNPTDLSVQGSVVEKEVITLRIDTNLTTGYAWEVTGSGGMLEQIGEPKIVTISQRLGAPAQEEITFMAMRSGSATLQLQYRRSFEPQFIPTLRLELQTARLTSLNDLTNPLRLPESAFPQAAPGPAGPVALSTAPLPGAFSWLAQGKLPPIRNQSTCGSCWAFATVAPLEAAINIRDGASETDLSEQYLVSCNYNGYNCTSGGGIAHEYHLDAVPIGEPQAGAVLESAFPYTGLDAVSGAPCNPPHAHPYRLTSWNFINFNTSNTAAIKEAIYYHGPVSATVCVGSGFSTYKGGVFSTNEDCGAALVNHGITLVGWDDAQGPNGAWILRNSWGPSWGENGGYMRIAYGTSMVGAYASYVIYNSPPIPTLVSPLYGATVSPEHLIFDWSDAASANNYEIQVDDSASFSHPEIDAFTAASTYTPTYPLYQQIYWRVRSSAAMGNWSSWSAAWSVFVDSPNPVPVLTGIFPAYAETGDFAFTLEVTGQWFTSTSVVRWDGAARPTTKINDTTLQASISAADVAAAKTVTIDVYTPAPGGGISTSHNFYIQNARPVPNDDFDTPFLFTGGNFDHAEGVRYSTLATDDPIFPIGCKGGEPGPGYYTVWYRFTAPEPGLLLLDTSKSNYDTILAVWTGSRGALVPVGCHDDISTNPAITQSRLQIPVSPGTYFIEVASISKTLNLANNSLVLDGAFLRPFFLPAVFR